MLRLGRVTKTDGKLRTAVRRGALVVAALGAAATIAFVWLLYFAPLPKALREKPRPLTAIYLDSEDRLVAEIASDDARSHRPVSLDKMGPWVPSVTISLEDSRYHHHGGVD